MNKCPAATEGLYSISVRVLFAIPYGFEMNKLVIYAHQIGSAPSNAASMHADHTPCADPDQVAAAM